MLCMLAKLDTAATEKLAALQDAAPADFPGRRPLHGHITLAAYTGPDEASFLRFGRTLADGLPAFSVAYEKLAVLEETSILAALPEKTGALAELHRRAAEVFGGELDPWTRDAAWLPHTTLFYAPEADLQALCRRLSANFAPFSARVCALEFSRVLPSGYEIPDRVSLPG